MSSTVSSAATATTTACVGLYDTPTHDANCAMPYGGNHTEIMAACCNGADVVSYYDDCGLYCLAEGQTVEDLILCLYDNGAGWSDVFCSGSSNATATGTTALPTGVDASVVYGTGTATSHKTSTKTSTKTGTTTGTATGTSSSSSNSSSAASGTRPQAIVSTLGLAVSALLFSVFAFGMQQM